MTREDLVRFIDTNTCTKKNETFNSALEYLQTNPNDSEAQARLKMAIEDVVVALPIEGGLALAKTLRKGSKDPIAQEIANQPGHT